MPGEYTVEVTNPEPCTAISEPYVVIDTPTNAPTASTIRVYPNPTNDYVFLEGMESNAVESVRVYDVSGKRN
jgi:hypothetical protein